MYWIIEKKKKTQTSSYIFSSFPFSLLSSLLNDITFLLLKMDATVKPLRIPPEMSVYAEKHEIFDLIQVSNILTLSILSINQSPK